ALRAGLPLFGICFGNQIFARALGFGTYKLRFGHRGINQPVRDLRTRKVEITTHNHGFAVAWPGRDPGDTRIPTRDGADSYPAVETEFGVAEVSHVCLNDGVIEGLRLRGPSGTE